MKLGHRAINKSFLFVLSIALFMALSSQNLCALVQGSSFNGVYDQVFSEPYEQMPTYKVDSNNFGKKGNNPDNLVLKAGVRSLTLEQDLYDFPNGQKIFQANGICFSGKWHIDQPSNFTGLFSEGTQVPVIARASVALSGTLQKHKRAFGMAVKLFPAQDLDKSVKTQNLFVMHSLGGIKAKHVLDLPLDNEPALGAIPPISQIGKMLRLRKDFEMADRQVSGGVADVSFRSVNHLAKVPLEGATIQSATIKSTAIERTSMKNTTTQPALSPTWIRLRADHSLPRVDHDDFRNELRTEHYPQEQLIWTIEAGFYLKGKQYPKGKQDEKRQGEKGQGGKKQASWQILGQLILNESITSAVCDQRLHFKHPAMGSVGH